MLLTREEIAHFKREGFVIRYGLLDPGLMAKCRDRLWQGAPVRMDRDDPTTYFGPLRKDEEIGSGSHGIMHNSKAGFIWKERAAGGEQLMLDLLPRALMPIAEQLLGKGRVVQPSGEDVGTMLGVSDDENFPHVLAEVSGSSDIGIKPLCARYLHLIEKEEFPVKLMEDAKLYEMFVVGTRARGIYATLPQPPGTQRPLVSEGGHNDGHPFVLGVEAYIDDVPPNGGGLQLYPQAHRRVFSSYRHS